MSVPEKDNPVPPDNENVTEGKKAIKAEELTNPQPAKEKDQQQEADAEQWRNEG